MKKHNEGYVLVYVTVVLILFSLIGSMILTSAMKNLNAQQAAITQMQDKYAAQGKIEQMMAERRSQNYTFKEGSEVGETGIVCVLVEHPCVTLQVTYGTVCITFTINTDTDAYVSYEVAVAPTEPSETEVPTE